MANWKKKINISTEFQSAKAGEITIQQLAGIVAGKLKGLKYQDERLDERVEELVGWFTDVSQSTSDNVEEVTEEFDSAMDDLYDFGDTTLDSSGGFYNTVKALWVNTIP